MGDWRRLGADVGRTVLATIACSALVVSSALAEPAPSGRYGLHVDCDVEQGMGVCEVGVFDLETGVELFRPHLSSRLGLATGWRAAAELDGDLYSFELTALVRERSARVDYVVRRDQKVIEHLVVQMQLAGAWRVPEVPGSQPDAGSDGEAGSG